MLKKKGLRVWAAVLAAAMLLAAFAGCRQGEGDSAPDFTVTEASPSQGECEVSVALPCVALTFSQAVRSVNVEMFSLYEQASNRAVLPASAEIVANGVFLNFTQKLQPETSYTLHLMPAAATALTGALSAEFSLEFTTGSLENADTQPPALIQTYPENNGADFDPNGDLILLFNEPIMSAEQFKGIILTDSAGSRRFAEAEISGSRLCVHAELAAGEAYTLSVPACALQDYAMNVLNVPIRLDFSTAKQTAQGEAAPRVLATVPRDGMTDVAAGSLISVVFDAEIRQGGAWREITVAARDGKNCLTNAKISKNELQLSAAMKAGEKYKVTVPENALKNAAGIGTDAVSFSFTVAAKTADKPVGTKDTQPPKVVLTVPSANASGVSVNLPEVRIRFDENIINGSSFLSASLEAQSGKKGGDTPWGERQYPNR